MQLMNADMTATDSDATQQAAVGLTTVDISEALPKTTSEAKDAKDGSDHHAIAEGDANAAIADKPTMIVDPHPHGQWYHAAFHITTVIVGTGVLGLPRAMAQLTWIPGIIMLALAYVVSYYTASLLMRMHLTRTDEENKESRRLRTYFAVGVYVLGKRNAKLFVAPFQYTVLVGTSIAYLIASGENINSLYVEHCGTECSTVKQLVWTSAVAGLQLILCFFPSLESVSAISMVAAVASIGYCVISVSLCFYLGQQPGVVYGAVEGSTVDNVFNFFTGISTIAFAFGVHMILPEIQATLAPKPCPKRESIKGLSVAWSFVLVLYFCSAVSGYWAFGQTVQGNILLSIQAADASSGVTAAVTVAQVLVVLHVVIAYQVLSMPVYAAMQRQAVRHLSFFPANNTLATVPLRFTYILLTWFVAIAIPFFGDIMSLFGALGITPLTFVLPCIMYLRYKQGKASTVTKGLCWSIATVGVFVGVAGTIASVRQIIVDADTFQVFA